MVCAGTFASVALIVLFNSAPTDALAQDAKAKQKKKAAPAPSTKPQFATDPATLKVAKGFKVELIYSVPKETQGSWVNLCTDSKGRLIASDQYGPLYRITPPPIGSTDAPKIETIPAEIGDAQGLLWAFDSLYVMVNSKRKLPSGKELVAGLYRVTSKNNDDTLDTVEQLMTFVGGGGEHGPHAILLNPDGKRLTLVCGNQTELPKFDTTKVPPHWGDDHLLARLPDGNGFMRGRNGPGGFILNVDPNGKNVELFSVGFRNQYDAAYNAMGDLFSYDADMEWDINTPWYRPTRVCLVTAGSDFGWRNGAGKYPPYYLDTMPGICDIGPGSPTGTCFGYGAKFPAKFQNAYFICDWSYGKLYAIHSTPEGTGYKATSEEFISGTPLPLTDVIIHPTDGAMYFTIGGRKTQSGLYRVTYVGTEPTAPNIDESENVGDEAKARKRLETNMGKQDPALTKLALAHLSPVDKFLATAARNTLEFQDPKTWAEALLSKPLAMPIQYPDDRICGALALARSSVPCPSHAKPDSPKADPAIKAMLLKSLAEIEFKTQSTAVQLELLRTYQVVLHRFGKPSEPERELILKQLTTEPSLEPENRYVLGERLPILVYLEAPNVAAYGMGLMRKAATQEEQIEYARSLRVLNATWTPELRKEYAEWFVKARDFRGGKSLSGFLKLMRDDFAANLNMADRKAFAPIFEKAAAAPAELVAKSNRPIVKQWTLDELANKVETGLVKGRNFANGQKVFAEAKCYGCHRVGNDGSAFGPDLSGIAGRFSPKDLLESILLPNKEVSDQYAAVEIETEDGKTVVGRIVNLNGNTIMLNTNMLDPNAMTNVNRDNVSSMKPSKTSMMPAGLMDILTDDEILDLLAYLLSRGDRDHKMFQK